MYEVQASDMLRPGGAPHPTLSLWERRTRHYLVSSGGGCHQPPTPPRFQLCPFSWHQRIAQHPDPSFYSSSLEISNRSKPTTKSLTTSDSRLFGQVLIFSPYPLSDSTPLLENLLTTKLGRVCKFLPKEESIRMGSRVSGLY